MDTQQELVDVKYCYILNYNICTIGVIVLTDEDKKLSPIDLLSKYGCHESECAYMFTNSKITTIAKLKQIKKLQDE